MSPPDRALPAAGHGVDYELRRSPRRRTLSIEVHPDLRVIVRAPARADDRFIAERVAERGPWINRALERFRRKGHQPARTLRYLDGETHYYLGEPCCLRIRRAASAGVTVTGGEIQLSLRGEATPERARRALTSWYRERMLAETAAILAARFDYFQDRGHRRPVVSVRAMRTRWGSLAGKRRMSLNLALIRAPRACLEYVVVHELCHLEHGGHGRAFYRLLDALMPDWRERKQRLEASLAHWPMAA